MATMARIPTLVSFVIFNAIMFKCKYPGGPVYDPVPLPIQIRPVFYRLVASGRVHFRHFIYLGNALLLRHQRKFL